MGTAIALPALTAATLATSAPATAPRLATATASDAQIWQAARKFEAMAIGQLLQPMFATVDLSQSAFGGGPAEAAWQPMLVDAMAQQMAQAGGIGLASAVHAVLLREQEQGKDGT